MTKAIDLASLDTQAACDRPFSLELKHPVTGAPLGCGVQIVGKDSAKFKDHIRQSANEQLRRNAQAQRRGKDIETPTIEQIEERGVDLLVACTTGFFGEILLDKEVLTYSPDNARKLYTRFPWAREQVDAAVGDIENFMQA